MRRIFHLGIVAVAAALGVWAVVLSGPHGPLPGPGTVSADDITEEALIDDSFEGPCPLSQDEVAWIGDINLAAIQQEASALNWVETLQALDAYGSPELDEATALLNNIRKLRRQLELDYLKCNGITLNFAPDHRVSGDASLDHAVLAVRQSWLPTSPGKPLPRRVKRDMTALRSLFTRLNGDQTTLDTARGAVGGETRSHNHVARHRSLETAFHAADDGAAVASKIKTSIQGLVHDYRHVGLKPVVFTLSQAKALVSYVKKHGALPAALHRELVHAGFTKQRIRALTQTIAKADPPQLVIDFPNAFASRAFTKNLSLLHLEFAGVAQTMQAALADIPPECSINSSPENPTTVLGRNDVAFTSNADDDTDGGRPASYHWTFGDGGTSSEANPHHVYAARGTWDNPQPYTVTLTVTENDGPKKCVQTGSATVVHNYPPNVNWGDSLISAYQLQFNGSVDDSSDGGHVTSITWNFGDGTVQGPEAPTDDNLNPTHTFAHSGLYHVTLTAVDSDGDSTDNTTTSDSGYPVQVGPAAAFNVDPGFASTEPAQFTDASSLDSFDTPIVTWSWNFGDGSPVLTGSDPNVDENPSHQYATPGTYTVTLTVTDQANQTDHISQQVTVPSS